jgi:hypothetical protein
LAQYVAVLWTLRIRTYDAGIVRQSVKRLFAVIRSRGPAWNGARPLDDQVEWTAHAAFMNGLLAEGFVALGGPLEGTPDVLLIVRATDTSEIAERLAADPWAQNGLLIVKQTYPWWLRLGSLA